MSTFGKYKVTLPRQEVLTVSFCEPFSRLESESSLLNCWTGGEAPRGRQKAGKQWNVHGQLPSWSHYGFCWRWMLKSRGGVRGAGFSFPQPSQLSSALSFFLIRYPPLPSPLVLTVSLSHIFGVPSPVSQLLKHTAHICTLRPPLLYSCFSLGQKHRFSFSRDIFFILLQLAA